MEVPLATAMAIALSNPDRCPEPVVEVRRLPHVDQWHSYVLADGEPEGIQPWVTRADQPNTPGNWHRHIAVEATVNGTTHMRSAYIVGETNIDMYDQFPAMTETMYQSLERLIRNELAPIAA